jgi:hypothetical protein
MDVANKTATTSSLPSLLGRSWFVTGGNYTTQAPIGTTHVVARGVGSGGVAAFVGDGGGGGGAYIKAIVPISPADVLHAVISGGAFFGVNDGGTPNIFLASGGQDGTSAIPFGQGASPVAYASQYAVIQRSGANGAARQGGQPGNDEVDIDTLGLTGVGATPSGPATGFGAGGACQQTGVGSFQTFAATGAVIVLEYWSGDPR